MRQDRFLMGILVGIGLIVVLAVGLFLVRRAGLNYGPEETPAGVARNFLIAIKKGDYDRAYAYLADFEGKPDPIAFRQTYQQFQASDVFSTGIQVGEAIVDQDRAVVQISMLRGGDALFGNLFRDQQAAELVQTGGAWKIQSMPYPFWNFSWVPPVKPTPVP